MIKNLNPALAERGKIKIGFKGELRKSGKGNDYQLPKKLDHFRIVTMEKGADNNYLVDREIHKLYGPTPKEIAVRLLYDDIEPNMQTRYACYKGRQQWCSGNGETAIRVQDGGGGKTSVTCPCERQNPDYKGNDKCKMNGALSVIIDGVEVVGGVWKFRTTSYNSIMGILAGMALVKKIAGGPLAGILLKLRIAPKTVVSPADNKVQTVHVVSIEYVGSHESLQELGYQKALQQEKHSQRMDNIEQEVKRITATATDIVDEDVVDEFYPEQAMSDFEIPIMESTVDPKVVFSDELKDPNFMVFIKEAAEHAKTSVEEALQKAPGREKEVRELWVKWQAQQKEVEIQPEKVAEQEAEKATEGTTEKTKPDTDISGSGTVAPVGHLTFQKEPLDPNDDLAMMPNGKDDPIVNTDTGETQTESRPSDGMNRGDLLNRIQKFKKADTQKYLKMFKGKKPSDGKDEQLREWVDVIESASDDPVTEEDGIPF